jgi:hypothetical protein
MALLQFEGDTHWHKSQHANIRDAFTRHIWQKNTKKLTASADSGSMAQRPRASSL